jgi:cytochrome c553
MRTANHPQRCRRTRHPTSSERFPRLLHQEESIVRFPTLALAAAAALGATLTSAQGSDPHLARNLAATCANCHGTEGRSAGGTASLAGMPRADLVRKMQDFKSGKTPATIMHQLSKGYSDEQIELIAGFFAARPVQ